MDKKLASLLHDFELVAQAASHDLKDPLRQAVLDCQALLTKDHDNALLHEIQASLELVIKRIELLRLYSRLVQNQQPFQMLESSEAINTALTMLKEEVNAKQAVITLNEFPSLYGNRDQLVTLFHALLDNALRFCSPDRIPHITINTRTLPDAWEFSISDNGIGIDPVYHEFVFTLFQCLDNTTPNRSHGAGLSFCRKIAENHGGSMRYESDGERGTVFFVTLAR